MNFLEKLYFLGINPAPGSEVYYKVKLENYGDLGGEIKNVELLINGTENLTLDSSFTVIGNDVSTSSFSDTSMDNILGVFENNTLTFNIPSYKGQVYEFIYRAIINSNLEVGEEITTTCNWSIEEMLEPIHTDTISLGELLSSANIYAYGPDYTLPNEHIGYEFNIENTGNQALKTVTITENLPQENNYYRLKTGTFYFEEINIDLNVAYNISYTTRLGNTGVLGPFNTNTNTTVDLQFILDNSDNILILTWNLDSLSVGMKNKVSTKIDGIVKLDTNLNSTIVNELKLSYIENNDTILLQNSKNTLVQDICVLNTSFSQTFNNIPVKPR